MRGKERRMLEKNNSSRGFLWGKVRKVCTMVDRVIIGGIGEQLSGCQV